jgi:hypothetical protein
MGNHTRFLGRDHVAVDLDGDGTVQGFDGDHHAPGLFVAENDTAKSGEGAVFDGDVLSDTEEGPVGKRAAGGDESANGGDFGVVDGDVGFAESDDGLDAGGVEDAEAFGAGKPAEDVAGEQNGVQLFDSVRPAMANAMQRNVFLESLRAEVQRSGSFMLGTYAKGEPGQSRHVGTELSL